MLMLGAYQGRYELPKEIRDESGRRRRVSRSTPSRPPILSAAEERRNGTSGEFRSSAASDSAEDGVAAVDRDGGTGDEVGGGARQEHGDAGHVLQGAPATGRSPPEHVVVELGNLPTRPAGEVGIDPTREHRVDLDVVPGPGGRERFGQLHDAAL